MKIGTFTFHCAHNYGAVLQAYALQKTLINMGHDNEIINYTPDEVAKPYELRIIPKPFSFKRMLTCSITYPLRIKKYKKFENFINNKLILTEKEYKTIDSIKKDINSFEILITGSDQVWNPEVSLLKPYYLAIEGDFKKVSYAASFGINNLREEDKDIISKYIKGINNISVREKDAVDIIDNLIHRQAEHVLDPVFLLDKEEWRNLCKNIKAKEEKYILIYSMEENELLINSAKKISNYTGYKIKFINPDPRIKAILKTSNKNIKILKNEGPEEFISLIENAEIIITNSFHGTAFSIIFNKPFIAIAHNSRNSRLESLLEILGIKQQMIFKTIKSERELYNKAFYDTKTCQSILQEKIEQSKEFLKNSII